MKEPPIIRTQNMSFAYDDSLILDKVNVEIFLGECIGVFGPNGGGKTTFLKLVAGLLAPKKGKIVRHNCKKIGYVPQFSKFDKQFPITVLDLVLMGCLSDVSFFGILPKEAKKRAQKALERVDLLDKQNEPFGTLSGGQAQRALIARAIVNDPDLLLLDEPTASVDVKSQKGIYDLLSSLKNQNMTILMVSHDLQAILERVDRVLCVHYHISSLDPPQVCKHFALGLYHTPIMRS